MAVSPNTQAAVTSTVASSATVVTLLPANGRARMRTISNESTAILYIKYGSAASLTDYTASVGPTGTNGSGYYEFPVPLYGGIVTGIWAAANGNARITEY